MPRYKELSNFQRFKNKLPLVEKIEPQIQEDAEEVTKEYKKFEKMITERKRINSDVYVGVKPGPNKKALSSKDEFKEQKLESIEDGETEN